MKKNKKDNITQLTYKDFIREYSYVQVIFDTYYKHEFRFMGVTGDETVFVYGGGNASDIYRFNIGRDEPIEIVDIERAIGINYAYI